MRFFPDAGVSPLTQRHITLVGRACELGEKVLRHVGWRVLFPLNLDQQNGTSAPTFQRFALLCWALPKPSSKSINLEPDLLL